MNKQPEQAIEEYLDQLSAQLLSLPPQLQSETREELRQHLHSLVAMQRDPQRILESALRQFGDPAEIGCKLALEWEEDQWSLRGLTLLQRIDKIRESGSLEIAEAKSSRALKSLNWIQVAFLLLAYCSEWIPRGPRFSDAASHIVHFGGMGLYVVIGLISCVLQWRIWARRTPHTATERNRIWGNIIARAGMAVFIPCMLSFPDHTFIIMGAMIVLCVASTVLTGSSPRTRLLLKSSMVYGLVMGGVLGVGAHLIAAQGWLWWLLVLVMCVFGHWFWKRSPLWAKK